MRGKVFRVASLVVFLVSVFRVDRRGFRFHWMGPSELEGPGGAQAHVHLARHGSVFEWQADAPTGMVSRPGVFQLSRHVCEVDFGGQFCVPESFRDLQLRPPAPEMEDGFDGHASNHVFVPCHGFVVGEVVLGGERPMVQFQRPFHVPTHASIVETELAGGFSSAQLPIAHRFPLDGAPPRVPRPLEHAQASVNPSLNFDRRPSSPRVEPLSMPGRTEDHRDLPRVEISMNGAWNRDLLNTEIAIEMRFTSRSSHAKDCDALRNRIEISIPESAMERTTRPAQPSPNRRGLPPSCLLLDGSCRSGRSWLVGGAAADVHSNASFATRRAAMANADEVVTLFVSNLPSELQASEFTRLFSQLDGCVGSRIRKDKNGKYVHTRRWKEGNERRDGFESA
eukprot:scaffold2636_cov340-Pavlova_lutheri.AAC.166